MPVKSADLPEWQDEYIRDYCEAKDVHTSEAMREFLKRGIQAHDSRYQWSQEARIGGHMLGLIGVLALGATLYLPIVPTDSGIALTVTVFIFAVCLSVVSSIIAPEGV